MRASLDLATLRPIDYYYLSGRVECPIELFQGSPTDFFHVSLLNVCGFAQYCPHSFISTANRNSLAI